MSDAADSKSDAWRGPEQLWLDAAYEALVASGVEAVKIMPLAKSLNFSRTSFYWHFSDRDALLTALIQRWRDQNTGNLVMQTELYAETIAEAVLNLFDCWIDPTLFDAKLDFAVRNWAQQAEEVRAAVEQADLERIRAIGAMFARFDYPAREADTRAKTIYYTQIGYISMMVDETLATRLERVPEYVETFTGRPATPSEIARFTARHQPRGRGAAEAQAASAE